MRRILILLISVLLFPTTALAADDYTATESPYPILVDGQQVTLDQPALNINGTTYVPLKLLGELLKTRVRWNPDLMQIEIGDTPKQAATTPAGYTLTGDANGIGTLSGKDGLSYHGQLKGGLPSGKGDMRYHSTQISGTFTGVNSGNGHIAFPDHSTYDGEWKNYEPNGYGKLYNSSGMLTRNGVFVAGAYDNEKSNDYFEQRLAAYMQKQNVTLTPYDITFWADHSPTEKFAFGGTATISSDYRFGYLDEKVKPNFFAVSIKPYRQPWREQWVVYFERSKFGDLHEALINGSGELKVDVIVNEPMHRGIGLDEKYAEAIDVEW